MIYRWRPNQPSITTGDFLGDMTDELDGDVITEFVSGGAKNYGYTTRAGNVVCKVRGLTLNVRGSAILNFLNSLRIRLASGLSPKFEHCHPLSFSKGSRKETNSSGSGREAVWVGV